MPPTVEPNTERSAAAPESLLRARLQALEDLTVAESASVTFVRANRPAVAIEFLDALEDRALEAGFVTARVAVFTERAFDAFDSLVRAVGRGVRAGSATDSKHGLVALLDAFLATRGDGALAEFDTAAARHHAFGDLLALARAYLVGSRQPAREAARIEAWLAGTELTRADAEPVALAALVPRTAKRALAEITALARVLGHRGTLLVFEGAEVLARLPAARRESAYTVLRELVDNTDGGRGMVATSVLVVGNDALFEGPRSITSLPPLAARVLPGASGPDSDPPPHRPYLDLGTHTPEGRTRSRVRAAPATCRLDLRALIRAAQGLPAVDPAVSMSVGHERIDATITELFDHSAMEGSVFALLVGAYGTGKTHLLIHLAARALADRRPVLRLSLEQLDADLGNPQRHLRRLLENATLPVPGNPGPLDRLVAWTRSPRQLQRLVETVDALAGGDADVASAALRAQKRLRPAKQRGVALEGYLRGADLEERPATPSYRQDAYGRLLLWLALLERLEGCAGQVLIVDEAENLYHGGTTRAERRTALRSLAFYCGGALPRACVVMAITPNALTQLRKESRSLLAEVSSQKTTLAWEDGEMLARRLRSAKPIEVPALQATHRTVLAFRVREAHARVRGPVQDRQWARFVESAVVDAGPPRELIRRVVDRLEGLWSAAE